VSLRRCASQLGHSRDQKIESNPNFDQLFTANYSGLTRLVYRVVGDIGWAEELAAEELAAEAKLHCNPPASDHNLMGWLYRTGIGLAFDNLKHQKLNRSGVEDLTRRIKLFLVD
jgi:DNA-directed RNA polymerase specialized sigma24 family protein